MSPGQLEKTTMNEEFSVPLEDPPGTWADVPGHDAQCDRLVQAGLHEPLPALREREQDQRKQLLISGVKGALEEIDRLRVQLAETRKWAETLQCEVTRYSSLRIELHHLSDELEQLAGTESTGAGVLAGATSRRIRGILSQKSSN